ncbi:hypothetical protein LG296_20515 (plasmid) [Ureibacillus chungkukjangi]|uniref:hypothetical protein n=1 Tax=Ureibacillus chungkukjangi TaxID=1202712 RepID=UPI000D39DFCF|nr:hypothetical protein [Ureibacillus chungkukjangi]MCM3390431.1 hypothetical protein [Ureibacillus chungkukjangi]
MKTVQINQLENRLSHLNREGQQYIQIVFETMPKFTDGLSNAILKTLLYPVILMATFTSTIGTPYKLIFLILITTPLLIEMIINLTLWQSYRILQTEALKTTPDYELVRKNCLDNRKVTFHILFIGLLSAVTFSIVAILLHNGWLMTIVAAAPLLFISNYKGKQSLLKTRLFMYVSRDLGGFKKPIS